MFTGIVETVGNVVGVEPRRDGRLLEIEAPAVMPGIRQGASVSVDGACLTVIGADGGRFRVEVVSETLSRTTLGGKREGSRVNLERAMPAGGRFDGHVVQGHVDGVGRVAGVVAEGEGRRMTVEMPRELLRFMVEKGSVTVDGVSLTIAALDPSGIEIALIPHTLTVTTLGERRPDDGVNIEVDILAKYVERLLVGTHTPEVQG